MTKADETKRRLADALAETLEEMPFDRVTVTELARRCGIERQSFYYHFHDLHGLAAWSIHWRVAQAVALARSDRGLSELGTILEALHARRELVTRIMVGSDRAELERILKDELGVIAMRYVEEIFSSTGMPVADRSLIARFFTAGTVEIVEAWVEDGMRERPERLARRLEQIYASGIKGLKDGPWAAGPVA